jgi:hypothetical protein
MGKRNCNDNNAPNKTGTTATQQINIKIDS